MLDVSEITTYSYKSEITLSINDIITKVKEYDPVKLVEITGGEPLIQSEIYDLFTILFDNEYEILLETNGTIYLEKVPNHVTKIVDVKCPGSGEENSFLLENLEFINKEKDEIKFVLSDNFDYNWAKDFVMKYNLIDYEILFSPVLEKLEPQKLAKWITEDNLLVRMQLQLHKIIWGKDKRGV
jgi:7-carboxy-7-deazaguanine synthase